MDTQIINIYASCVSELDALAAPSHPIDLTDCPLSAALVATFTMDPNFFVTSPNKAGNQFAYLSNWHRVINGDQEGIPNFFTWLDAYTATPAIGPTGCPNVPPLSDGLCVRQGFGSTTRSLSPYVASSVQDVRLLGNIFDTLGAQNPSSIDQLMDWMTIRHQELGCVTVKTLCDQSLGYTAPTGTTDNFRFFLRPPQEMFWQDGHQLTAFDVAFSFASLRASGAFLGSGLSSMTCNLLNCADGISVVGGTRELDIHLTSSGPFTLPQIMTTPVIPGHLWSTCASSWDSTVMAASVMPSTPIAFPTDCLSVDPPKLAVTYDPIQNGVLIGSGPWECVSTGVSTPGGTLGSGCSSTGSQNPPAGGRYILTRNGFGSPAGSSPSKEYFRSSANLAYSVWSLYTGDFTSDPLNFSEFASCVGKPAPALGPCLHWQEGIGTPGGPSVIDGIQVSIMLRFAFIDPVKPFTVLAPPINLVVFNPLLYQGSVTFTPSNGNPLGCPDDYDC